MTGDTEHQRLNETDKSGQTVVGASSPSGGKVELSVISKKEFSTPPVNSIPC